MKKIFILLIVLQIGIYPQTKKYIRDTSYTPYNVYQKEIKKFPFIKIVKPILADSVDALRNITYAEYGNRKLSLDLFFPSGKQEGLPAVILIHGGGWRTGSKANLFPLALRLAQKGYFAVAVEYRLANEAIFPAAVIDINNSIKWLKKNSVRYNVDTSKIAILGCSAGGQLASLAAYSVGEKDFEDDSYPNQSSRVYAVINVDGLMDFLGEGSEEFDENPNPDKPRAAHQWIGASQIERPDLWKKASAINYIKPDSPPILFINSSIPRFHAGRDEAIKLLNTFGIYSKVITLENTPHPFWLFHPWFNRTLLEIEGFLEKVM